MSVLPSYESILRKSMMESGRPLHPAFEHALDEEWIDPTAQEAQRENGGGPITKRERSMMSAISYYSIEGLLGGLTPLGMATLAEAMCGFLGLTDEEIEHGFEGIEADPWHETRHLSAEARDQFRRADWHISEAFRLMGLDDRGQPISLPEKLPCGCPSGTHDASISEISAHHRGVNPWPIRELFAQAKERGEWSP